MKRLTEKQKRACDILLAIGKPNKTFAYTSVYKCRGRTANKEATKLFQKPHVKAYLTRARKDEPVITQKTRAEIIGELERLGFSKLTDFMHFSDKGIKLFSSKDIPIEKLGALKAITVHKRTWKNKKGRKGQLVTVKVDLHDKKAALDSLCKINAMFTQTIEAGENLAKLLHEAMKDET